MGIQKISEMSAQLPLAFIMAAFDSRVLDCPVDAFDLPFDPGMIWLCQPMRGPVGLADHVAQNWSGMDGVPISRLLGELDAVIHCPATHAAHLRETSSKGSNVCRRNAIHIASSSALRTVARGFPEAPFWSSAV